MTGAGRVQSPDDNTCDRCPAFAPWSIADYNDDLEPITTWFAAFANDRALWSAVTAPARWLSARPVGDDPAGRPSAPTAPTAPSDAE